MGNTPEDCSVFEPTPESMGAMAALTVKAEAQGAVRFFDDPIHVRRDLIAKGRVVGWDTPAGHTISNIIEILQNLFEYERPAWAVDERQTLPWMMVQQVKRMECLSAPARQPMQLAWQAMDLSMDLQPEGA